MPWSAGRTAAVVCVAAFFACGGGLILFSLGVTPWDPPPANQVTLPPTSSTIVLRDADGARIGGPAGSFDARLGPRTGPDVGPTSLAWQPCADGTARWSARFDDRGAVTVVRTYCSDETNRPPAVRLAEARAFLPKDAEASAPPTSRSGETLHLFRSASIASERPSPTTTCSGAAAPAGTLSVVIHPPSTGPAWTAAYGACV